MANGSHKYDKETTDLNSCYFPMCSWYCDDCHGNQVSEITEVINVAEMVGRTLLDGKVVAEFKCERCDNCERIEILDRAGYQRDVSGTPILWFCGQCRK